VRKILYVIYGGDAPPELTTPDGVQISADVVGELAGGVEQAAAEPPAEAGEGDAELAAGTDSAGGGGGGLIADNPDVITGTDGEPIGNVENISGTVWAIRTDGTKVELEIGDPVYQGDILESAPDGAVGVLLADETTFSMAENGRMVLDEMIYDPATEDGSVSLSVLQGVFTFVSGQVAKTDPDAMTLDTPVATIGIRGTQVGIEIPDGENLNVVLMEEADGFVGEVVVLNDAGSQVLNNANQFTVVQSFDLAPTEIELVEETDMVENFAQALQHLPLVHGNQNDFGLQDSGEEEFLDEEIQEIEEDLESLDEFDTAAGEEEPTTEEPEEITVTADTEFEVEIDFEVPEVVEVEPESEPEEVEETVEEVEEVIIPTDDDGRILVDVDGEFEGGDQAEFITGGGSDDTIDAGGGDDVIDAGGGDDFVDGGEGSDIIDGGEGSDELRGSGGNDAIEGGVGDDVLVGGAGSDTLDGGAGDDVLVGGHVDEGGTVTVDTDTGAVTFTDTDGIVNENDPAGDDTMIGGAGADTIVGGDGDDVAFGGTGDDVIHGRAGDDTLDGGAGDDVIFGGSGADVINGGASYDTVDAGTGDDTVFLTNSDATIDGGAGTDTLVVAGAAADADLIINLENASVTSADGSVTVQYLAGFENIVSGDGDDVIIGSELDNVITGGLGDDTIIGGSGDDTAVFRSSFSIDGTSETTVTFDPEAGTITVEGPDGTDTVSGVENLAFDGLNVSVIDAPTLEDTAFDLDASGSFEDLLSEGAVSITISGVPDGAELLDSAGNPVDAVIEGNTWTLRAETETTVDPETGEETVTVITPLEDVLAGLTIRPDEHSDDDFTLWIGGQNANGGSVGEASMVNMVVTGVADMPNLEVGDVYGVEDEFIALDISAGLVDTDTSETLSINISGIPQGTGFNTDGTYSELRAELPNGDPITFALDPNSDNYTIEGYTPTEMESILQSLEIKPPFNHDEDFDLTFAVTATEADGDSATATSISTVNVMPLADQPNLALRVQEQQEGTPILADGQIIQVDNQEDVAIPLNILPESMDPSEILSLSVSGIPDGAVFEYGIDVAGQTIYVQLPVIDGTVSVPIPNPDVPGGPIPEIATRVTPPHNSNVDFQLTVTATSTEPEAEYRLEPMGAFEDFGNTVESVTISGFPPGTEFSEGTDNGDGTWTLQGYTETVVDPVSGEEITLTKTLAEVLEDVTVTPPLEATGDMSLQIAALDDTGATIADNDITFPVEVDGVSVSSLSGVLNIELTGDADPVDIEINDVTGDEDTAIPLDITANLTDTDGSETLSITITGVPAGATLSVGTVSDVDEVTGLQTWTIDPIYETNSDGEQVLVTSVAELLETLTITPPEHSDEEIDLQVTVTNFEHEEDGTVSDQEPSGPFDLKVNVNAVADLPNVGVQDASGKEDQAIDLSISPAELVDTDGSETLSITISGVPDGAELTSQSPTGEPITLDVVDGSVTLTEQMIADGILDNLQVTPPGDSNVNFELTVTATATEAANGDTATNTQFIEVDVEGVADTPFIDAELNEQPVLNSDGQVLDPDGSITYDLNIQSYLNDTDGSESLSLTLGPVPVGVTFNIGTAVDNGDGTTTWTVSSDDLASLSIDNPISGSEPVVPSGLQMTVGGNVSDDFELKMTATATDVEPDIENDPHTDTAISETFIQVEVANDPDLFVHDAEGFEDTPLPLNMNAFLDDSDAIGDGETLSITISNIPDGATLTTTDSEGAIVPLDIGDDGSITLTDDQLPGLHIQAPPDSNEDFVLSVTATSTTDFGDIAETTLDLPVQITGIADDPDLDLGTGEVVGEPETAIPLAINTNLNDLDGSETLTVSISNLPTDAVLSVDGVPLEPVDGVYTLGPDNLADQLAGLTVTPPPGSEESFTLLVTATASDFEPGAEGGALSDTATVGGVLNVVLDEGADPPIVNLGDAQGYEDTAIALNIDAQLQDLEETLTITISDVPSGATLSAGNLNPDGSYTLTQEQLANLTITPPADSNVDFDLTVAVTSIDGDSEATVTETLHVDVIGVADAPNLATEDATGQEDTFIPLDVSSSLNDTDDSETLTITIGNVPEGAVLSILGGGPLTPDPVDGTYTLTTDQLDGLGITPPPGSDADFTLDVTATTVEDDGDTATVNGLINVDVQGILLINPC